MKKYSVRGTKRVERRMKMSAAQFSAELKMLCPVHHTDLDAMDAEFEAERQRILDSFGKREPAVLGPDFFKGKMCFAQGGTALRRKQKREAKKMKKVAMRSAVASA